jgi:hypothetical protein
MATLLNALLSSQINTTAAASGVCAHWSYGPGGRDPRPVEYSVSPPSSARAAPDPPVTTYAGAIKIPPPCVQLVLQPGSSMTHLPPSDQKNQIYFGIEDSEPSESPAATLSNELTTNDNMELDAIAHEQD